jgi:hypothetical protein
MIRRVRTALAASPAPILTVPLLLIVITVGSCRSSCGIAVLHAAAWRGAPRRRGDRARRDCRFRPLIRYT